MCPFVENPMRYTEVILPESLCVLQTFNLDLHFLTSGKKVLTEMNGKYLMDT